jgi:probable biosynthetic protein (TIGR04098 family)
MTMEKYIAILQDVIPGFTTDDLFISLKEPRTHVLDSIIIRDTLENHFGFQIPDQDWHTFTTLSESIDYCYNKTNEIIPASDKVTVKRRHDIRMPQMANAALSENWLLKEMGDMHWEMLSKGLEQKSTEFADSMGNRLYAAFVRINYAISPLNLFNENDTMHLNGSMKRFGDYAYYSLLNGHCDGKMLSAKLMTSFLARTANDNSRISRGDVTRHVNHITELGHTPDFYIEHRQVNKGKLDEIISGGHTFAITDKKVASIIHTINPHFEINGAGLLYFASYPVIADMCTSMFFRNTFGIKNYNSEYHTTYRDVFYFANCNADDRIIVDLNNITHQKGDLLKLTTSLYRESDGKLMAKVFTVKQKSLVD